MRSNQVLWIGLAAAMWLMRRQKCSSDMRAPSGPSIIRPWATTAAFIAPALVAEMPSIAKRPSSSSRSSTPQVKAPCAPPPCRARLMCFRLLAGCPFFFSMALLGGPASFDRQRDAGNRGRRRRAQEDGRGRNFFGFHELLRRLPREQNVPDHLIARDVVRLRLVIDLLFHQRCADIAGAKGVAGDAVL